MKIRRENYGKITQSKEYRLETLKQFSVDIERLNLEAMPDTVFNDLVFKLDALRAQEMQDKRKIERGQQENQEALLKLREEETERQKQEQIKRMEEEQQRLEQIEREEKNLGIELRKRQEREKVIEEKRKVEPHKEEVKQAPQSVVDDVAQKFFKKKNKKGDSVNGKGKEKAKGK